MASAGLLVARGSAVCSASTAEKRLERVRSSFGTGRHHAQAGFRCNRVSIKLRARQEGANDKETSATAPSSALTSLRQLV